MPTNAGSRGVEVAGLRLVARTGRAPQDTVVSVPSVARGDAAKVQQALLSYRPPSGRPAGAGSMERISGFVTARPDDFASIRELVQFEDAAP